MRKFLKYIAALRKHTNQTTTVSFKVKNWLVFHPQQGKKSVHADCSHRHKRHQAQTLLYHETWHQWDAANVPLFVYRRQPLRNSYRLCYQSNAKISCWEATEQYFGRPMKGRFLEKSDKDQRFQQNCSK